MTFKNILILTLTLALSACAAGPKVTYNKHTGETVAQSGVITAYDNLFSSVTVSAFHSSSSGYGIYTRYLSSASGWVFFKEAWSLGDKLDYRVGNRDTAMCGGGLGCSVIEEGTIYLSEDRFRESSKTGLAFQLVGSKGRVNGEIPASAFAKVLEQQEMLNDGTQALN